jgi:sugar O-acyltransferase (sialic acid O-acetyltransferase NeuD family)
MILYIYCAGGFGKEIMDVARRKNAITSSWSDIRFIDDSLNQSTSYGAKVLRFDQLSKSSDFAESEFLIANGEPVVRKKILDKLMAADAKLANLIDVSCLVADSAILHKGVVITPLCSISSDVVLLENSCVNTMSIIGHDVRVGNNSVISSMVNLGGACIVGDNSYIGMGALIKEGVKIGSNTIVGMGSVVYNDIPDGVIALGNPARVARPNSDQKVFK